jgi:hypothetical protein
MEAGRVSGYRGDELALFRAVNDAWDLRRSPYFRDALEALVDEWRRGWADRIENDVRRLDMERHYSCLRVVVSEAT